MKKAELKSDMGIEGYKTLIGLPFCEVAANVTRGRGLLMGISRISSSPNQPYF